MGRAGSGGMALSCWEPRDAGLRLELALRWKGRGFPISRSRGTAWECLSNIVYLFSFAIYSAAHGLQLWGSKEGA
jgi:hypothetical protein